ncbi:Formamidopyrimidine-DNA glycosylase [Sarracenia purpurea var. burkii]
MPELPEVEAARRAIEDHCVGKKIRRSMIADDPKVIDGVPPSDFEASLLGKTVIAAHRKGKNMWLQLDSPPFPSFQFGTIHFILKTFTLSLLFSLLSECLFLWAYAMA